MTERFDLFVIDAPWTPQQVEALKAWQRSVWVHPYTCPNRDTNAHLIHDNGHLGALDPTPDGWVCRWCDYTQQWAHGFSFDQVQTPPWATN